MEISNLLLTMLGSISVLKITEIQQYNQNWANLASVTVRVVR